MTKLEKQAQRGKELITNKNDLSQSEIKAIMERINEGKVFDAICQAFLAGFARGYDAAKEGAAK